MHVSSLSAFHAKTGPVAERAAHRQEPSRSFGAALKGDGGRTSEKSRAHGPLQRPKVATSAEASGHVLSPEHSQALTSTLARLRKDERRLDSYVRRALGGGDFSLQELVAMQSLVYRYTQRVEMLSKLVDRVTSAVKQALRTPV